MLDKVQVLLTVYEVNPNLSSIEIGDQVERIFIPPSIFKDHSNHFFLVANASNSETCSRISVQGSTADFDATFGPSMRLMLQSQDFPYGLLASIRNLPKNASICYQDNRGSDDVKVTSISIEDIDLSASDIILSISFSFIVFIFFLAFTYLPRVWPRCMKLCSNPDENPWDCKNQWDSEDCGQLPNAKFKNYGCKHVNSEAFDHFECANRKDKENVLFNRPTVPTKTTKQAINYNIVLDYNETHINCGNNNSFEYKDFNDKRKVNNGQDRCQLLDGRSVNLQILWVELLQDYSFEYDNLIEQNL